jgi:hypothetical protein
MAVWNDDCLSGGSSRRLGATTTVSPYPSTKGFDMPSLEVATGLPAARHTHRGSGAREAAGMGTVPGGQSAVPMPEQTSSFDAEYQQWRSEQLRKLEQTYPEWRQNSYKDFSESLPHSCGPGMACAAARPGPQKRRGLSAK